MLATLGALPTGPGWAYEYKFDGVRAVCYVTAGGDTRVMSRNEHDVTAAYPELAAALPRGRELILDGELVALDSHGHPSFARLQRRMNVHEPSAELIAEVPLTYSRSTASRRSPCRTKNAVPCSPGSAWTGA
jgi:bifunctional non-homologous end joining protein LigD